MTPRLHPGAVWVRLGSMKIAPRKPKAVGAASASTVKAAVKKPAAAKTGYAARSAFDGAVAQKVGGVVRGGRIGGSVNREISRDFLGIKRGLRGADDAAVKSAVGTLAQRLKLALPDTSKLTGWGAFGALGKVLGHTLGDPGKFNRDDYRHVMHLARAAGGKINDPDPSLRF